MQDYPYGFPWLSQSDRQVAEAANVLVLRSFELAKLAITHNVSFALEHPEQLGLVKGLVPGSIWDFEEFREILETSSSTTLLIGLCPSCLSVCFAGAGWVGKLGDKYFENVSLPSLAVL